MKTKDERELQNTTKETKQRQKGAKGTEAIVKKRQLIDFLLHLSSVFSS